MGFKKKSGKGRLDKYYHLAKEQGYRARSAFKLIQLNKKYNFLSSAKALIDLCAAPGGWLQVAQKYMPSSSIILGVDLVPIKPIPNVITFTEDITTDKCRSVLKQNLMNWEADVVLHDGAPNVGSAWQHDAFTQSELVLSSLKLATEFLKKGGTFVTKVFRSKDYNNLIWVFNNLFEKVEATKPPSSRNVSAEIFVVCQRFLAPKKIDPKFLDPRYVFEDLDISKPISTIDIFAPEKKQKKRHREGYEEGNYTQHKKVSAMEFINSKDPVALLGSVSELAFDSDEAKALAKYTETNQDIIIACQDLRVLGKKDLKTLLKWRLAMRKRIGVKDTPAEPQMSASSAEKDNSDEDSASASENELDLLAQNEKKRLRKERRRINEKRQKQIVKMQLNMTTPMDLGLDQGDTTLFGIPDKDKAIKKAVSKVDIDKALDYAEMSDSEDELEYYSSPVDDAKVNYDEDSDTNYLMQMDSQLENMYQKYTDRARERDSKLDIKKKRSEQEEFRGFSSGSESESDDNKPQSSFNSKDNLDMDMDSYRKKALEADDTDSDDSDLDHKKQRTRTESLLNIKNVSQPSEAQDSADSVELTKRASIWFDQPMFKNLNLSSILNPNKPLNEDVDKQKDSSNKSKKNSVKGTGEKPGDTVSKKTKSNSVSNLTKPTSDSSDFENDSDDGSDFNLPQSVPDVTEMVIEGQDPTKERNVDYSAFATPEALTIAHDLVNKKITKAELIDKYYNRYSFNQLEDLPIWYVDNERQYNKPNLPVSKEAMQMLRSKLKAINSRPIKKVMEAKARKKLHATQKMAKLKAKAESMVNNEDMTESEKAKNIDKLLKSNVKKLANTKRKVSVVVAKGQNRAVKGRPKGTKGKYKMVDRRLKKDARADKARKSRR
ncbi:hypothetical protein BB560_000887 [Smittium megazygosporum]|uniref:Uncharacterized protein n=1 Tax=Smittium megazygosporum TaxID=133381 RepID=A0A2T9ZJ80_9FUNG|nr:hypothetical protein BB560_000887 [Smittium megazygosporum]